MRKPRTRFSGRQAFSETLRLATANENFDSPSFFTGLSATPNYGSFVVVASMILCVGNSDERLLRLEAVLRAAQHRTFLCVDYSDALRVLAFQGVEMVIADDSLNSAMGRALIQQARTFRPRLPVVLWTALAASSVLAELDPDVVLAQTEGTDELLRIIAILQGKRNNKEES